MKGEILSIPIKIKCGKMPNQTDNQITRQTGLLTKPKPKVDQQKGLFAQKHRKGSETLKNNG